MLKTQEEIRKLKLEASNIDKILANESYSKADIGKFEYFISRITNLAESLKDFKNSSTITRIRELQKDKADYHDNLPLIIANTKALLDSLDEYFKI
ncbi:unnamed protein product [marine sediment metagenome]|uniref:Uncharacterized protein n=1 Tax=marine sediment metagenome TaxID=412755 RepID=X1UAC7_9ZZZZ